MSIDNDNDDATHDISVSKTTIYAELLSNLAQLSISISLPSLTNASTAIHLSNESTITVSHDGTTSSLRLPAALPPGRLPARQGTSSKTYRLPLASTLAPSAEYDAEVPWSAPTLNEKSIFSCKSCSATILGPLSTWRDLPSENWAEMMDFWHCHKPPPETNDGKEEPATKAYGFNNRIDALEGVGFVDLLHFLVRPEDCRNISITKGSSILTCQACTAPLGTRDARRSGYKLLKPSLAKKDRDESFGASPFLAALLGQQISLVGTRFFTVVRDPCRYLENSDGPAAASNGVKETNDQPKMEEKLESIKLWITTPATTYSLSSPSAHIEARRAMKVLFKSTIPSISNGTSSLPQQPETNGDTAGNSRSHNHNHSLKGKGGFLNEEEEIYLPPHLYASILTSVQSSTSKLSPEIAKFQDWNVALLDRF